MDKAALITEYLQQSKHMQLATVKDGQPWLCTVHFVADEDFNLYWMSARERRHSTEITNDSKAAVTVVRDTERKQALQMTGNASEVTGDDLERVHDLYQSKFGPKEYDLAAIKSSTTGRAYWVFKPHHIELWDEVNFPDSPKQRFDQDSNQ